MDHLLHQSLQSTEFAAKYDGQQPRNLIFYCDLCDRTIKGAGNFLTHKRGERHL